MFCPKCGKDVGDAKFCSNCGAQIPKDVVQEEIKPTIDKVTPPPLGPTKTKKKNGCLWIIVVVCIFLTVIMVAATQETNDDPDSSVVTESNGSDSDALLAFDDRSWPDFVALYNAHNALLSWVDAYANGQINSVDLYQKCEEVEAYFRDLSLSFNYGETEDQKDYLSVFKNMALSDQMAAQSLMKYLNSGKTGDLSDANANIQSATEAATIISSNRGTLLGMTDLTDDEIRQRIEETTKDLQ